MQIERKCINCTSFPCMREECEKDNVCEVHKFEHETMIEQKVDEITINIDDFKNIPIVELENPFAKIEKRINRSSLQFNGDTFYTLYTKAKFNKFQKFLWRHLLNIKISDVEE